MEKANVRFMVSLMTMYIIISFGGLTALGVLDYKVVLEVIYWIGIFFIAAYALWSAIPVMPPMSAKAEATWDHLADWIHHTSLSYLHYFLWVGERLDPFFHPWQWWCKRHQRQVAELQRQFDDCMAQASCDERDGYDRGARSWKALAKRRQYELDEKVRRHGRLASVVEESAERLEGVLWTVALVVLLVAIVAKDAFVQLVILAFAVLAVIVCIVFIAPPIVLQEAAIATRLQFYGWRLRMGLPVPYAWINGRVDEAWRSVGYCIIMRHADRTKACIDNARDVQKERDVYAYARGLAIPPVDMKAWTRYIMGR